MSRITVKGKEVERTKKLDALLEKKIPQLERLLPPAGKNAAIEIELGKATGHHKSGAIYRAEINLSYGKHLHRAEAAADSIENALDEATSELKAELRKARTKKKDVARKGSRTLKKMVRGE